MRLLYFVREYFRMQGGGDLNKCLLDWHTTWKKTTYCKSEKKAVELLKKGINKKNWILYSTRMRDASNASGLTSALTDAMMKRKGYNWEDKRTVNILIYFLSNLPTEPFPLFKSYGNSESEDEPHYPFTSKFIRDHTPQGASSKQSKKLSVIRSGKETTGQVVSTKTMKNMVLRHGEAVKLAEEFLTNQVNPVQGAYHHLSNTWLEAFVLNKPGKVAQFKNDVMGAAVFDHLCFRTKNEYTFDETVVENKDKFKNVKDKKHWKTKEKEASNQIWYSVKYDWKGVKFFIHHYVARPGTEDQVDRGSVRMWLGDNRAQSAGINLGG